MHATFSTNNLWSFRRRLCRWKLARFEIAYINYTWRPSQKKRNGRPHIIRSLWNGDVRKRGVIEHAESGCCESPQHTLKLMKTVGLKCLLKKLRVLMRDNWANCGRTLKLIALPTMVHGLLPQAILRTLKKTPAPVPRPIAPVGLAAPVGGALAIADNHSDGHGVVGGSDPPAADAGANA